MRRAALQATSSNTSGVATAADWCKPCAAGYASDLTNAARKFQALGDAPFGGAKVQPAPDKYAPADVETPVEAYDGS